MTSDSVEPVTQPDQVDAVVDAPSHGEEADDARWLLEYLADREVPCPLCGYNLRGLTSQRCPECGKQLQLTVRQAEPYLRAWILLAAAVTPGAGIGLLFLMLWARGGLGLMQPAELFVILTMFAALVLTPFVFMGRRRFLRLPRRVQNWISGIAAAIAVVAFVTIAGLILGS